MNEDEVSRHNDLIQEPLACDQLTPAQRLDIVHAECSLSNPRIQLRETRPQTDLALSWHQSNAGSDAGFCGTTGVQAIYFKYVRP